MQQPVGLSAIAGRHLGAGGNRIAPARFSKPLRAAPLPIWTEIFQPHRNSKALRVERPARTRLAPIETAQRACLCRERIRTPRRFRTACGGRLARSFNALTRYRLPSAGIRGGALAVKSQRGRCPRPRPRREAGVRISCGRWPLPFPHTLLQMVARLRPHPALGRSVVASSPSAVLAMLAMLAMLAA